MESTVRGRRQRLFENVEVHEYGSPVFSPTRRYAQRAPDLSLRYDSYRSRSQGPMRGVDRWQQTDDYLSPPIHSHESHRSRSATRSGEHTYRSYSSRLYDRKAFIEGQYPATYYEPPVDYPLSTQSTPVKRPEYNRAIHHGDLLIPLDHSTPRRPRREAGLRYQYSNLEEIPVTQLLEEFSSLEQDGPHGQTYIDTVPLETRLLEPGVHVRHEPNAPLRRAQQRARNYCVML